MKNRKIVKQEFKEREIRMSEMISNNLKNKKNLLDK